MIDVIIYTLCVIVIVAIIKRLFSFHRNRTIEYLESSVLNLQIRVVALEKELHNLKSKSDVAENVVQKENVESAISTKSATSNSVQQEHLTPQIAPISAPLEQATGKFANGAEKCDANPQVDNHSLREISAQNSTPKFRHNYENPEAREFSVGKFIDEYVVSKIFLWLGGLAIIFSGFFLAKYSIERGLLSPTGRIFATACFAVVLAVCAEFLRFREKRGIIASILFAAFLAVAYGDFYAASEYYSLMNSAYAFVGAVIVSLVGLLSVKRYGSGMIYLALLGTFLAPAIFSSDNPDTLTLISYLAVSTFVALKVSVSRCGYLQLFALMFSNILWLSAIIIGGVDSSIDCLWVLLYLVCFSFAYIWFTRKISLSDIQDSYPNLFDYQERCGEYLILLLRYFPLLFSTFAAVFVVRNSEFLSALPSLQLLIAILFYAEIFVSEKSNEIKIFTIIAALIIPSFLCSDIYTAIALAGISTVCVRNFYKTESIFYIVIFFVVFLPRIIWCKFLCFTLPFDVVTPLIFLSSAACFYRIAKKFGCDDIVFKVVISLTSILLSVFVYELYAETFVLFCGGLAVLCLCLVLLAKDKNFDVGIVVATFFFCVSLIARGGDNYCFLCASGALIYLATIWSRKGIFPTLVGDVASALSIFSLAYVVGLSGHNYCVKYSANDFTAVSVAVSVVGFFAVLGNYTGRFDGLRGIRIGAFILLLLSTIFATFASYCALTENIVVEGVKPCNVLFVLLLLPSIFAFLFRGEGVAKNISSLIGLVLLFVFANLEMRFCFQGNVISQSSSMAEFYSYSLLWLIFGIGLLAVGKKWGVARYLSIVFVFASVIKVFILDASILDGILRVMSFAVLGFVLICIGWAYSKYIFKTEKQ